MNRIIIFLIVSFFFQIVTSPMSSQVNGMYEIEARAGGLSSALPSDRTLVKELKVKGSLNSDDIRVIKELINLSVLDMSGTTIEIGGEGYTSKYLPGKLIKVEKVNEIPDAAFADMKSLLKVELPSSLVSIKSYAFRGDNHLESVVIPTSLVEIGAHCFELCESIEKITLNKNVISFPEAIFKGCSNLKSVDKAKPLSIGKEAFKDCSMLTTSGIITGLKYIGEEAYSGCKNITYVFIPLSVESVGNNAFAYCEKLRILFIRALENVGSNVFKGCKNLVSVSMPIGVKEVGSGMFEDCSNLKEFWASKDLSKINTSAFKNCENLSVFRIDNPDPPILDKNVFEGVSLNRVVLQIPNGATKKYSSTKGWKDFSINASDNDRGAEVVKINLKKGSKKKFKFGLRITQPYSVDMGNGKIYKGAPGNKVTSKSQIVCDEHGDVIKIYSMPNSLVSFIVNDLDSNDVESVEFNAPELDYIWLSNSLISHIDVSSLSKLDVLILSNNSNLVGLDLSNNNELRYLNISLDEKLKGVDLSNNSKLQVLNGAMLNFSDWNLSKNIDLRTIDLFMTSMDSLDISMLNKLKSIKLSKCNISKLMFPKNAVDLGEVFVSENNFNEESLNSIYKLLPVKEKSVGAKIYIKGNPGAEKSRTSIATKKNWIVDVNGTGGSDDPVDPNKDKCAIGLSTLNKSLSFNIVSAFTEVVYVDWGDKSDLEKINVEEGIIKGLKHTYSDGKEQHRVKIFAKGIKNMVSPFWSSMKLEYLDVSNCPMLEVLEVPNGNNLSNLDLTSNNALRSINLSGCKLETLKLPKEKKNLVSIRLSTNNLKELDVKGLVNLEILSIPSNSLKSIDLTGCNQLRKINLNLNGLEQIKGIIGLQNIEDLDIARNNLPFSSIPPKKDMKTYVYNQYWYDVPENLVDGFTIDLRMENKARGISDKEEQTTFKWFVFKSKDERIEITEDKYINENGLFKFKSEALSEYGKEILVYALMTNPGFPDINTKTKGLTTGLIKIIQSGKGEVDPSKFSNIFEGLYECAFRNAKNLREIKLPANTKEIRDYAFNNSKNLKVVGITGSIEKISAKAFDDQAGLVIYVPNEDVKSLFDNIFGFKVTEVVVGTVPEFVNDVVGNKDFVINLIGHRLIIQSISDKNLDVKVYGIGGIKCVEGILNSNSEFQYDFSAAGMYIISVNQYVLKIFIP